MDAIAIISDCLLFLYVIDNLFESVLALCLLFSHSYQFNFIHIFSEALLELCQISMMELFL